MINELLLELKNEAIEGYSDPRKSHYKIINSKLPLIGDNTITLKRLSVKYQNIDINLIPLDKYLELNVIYFLIGLNKSKTYNEQIEFIYKNKKHLDSWYLTDTTYLYLKEADVKEVIKSFKLFKNDEEIFLRRYAYLLLFKYIDKIEIHELLNLIEDDDSYYVYMCISWLISFIYIKYNLETYEYLKVSKLSLKTKLKAISKIIDSYRVSDKEKEKIKKLRNKLKETSKK